MTHAAFAALERVLAADGLPYDRAHDDEHDSDLLRAPFQGTAGRWMMYARADGGDALLRVYAVSPLEAAEDRRPAVLELVARINLALAVATLELDLDTGEVRARTGIDGQALSDAPPAVLDRAVSSTFYAAAAALDLWLPALVRVIERGEAPIDALTRTAGER